MHPIRTASSVLRPTWSRPRKCSLRPCLLAFQTRREHGQPRRNPPPVPSYRPAAAKDPALPVSERNQPEEPVKRYFEEPKPQDDTSSHRGPNTGFTWSNVHYLRPGLWALSVSSGIYCLMAYLEAKKDVKPTPGMLQHRRPQSPWPRQIPPTPTEVATRWLQEMDPISKLSTGIIATCGTIHLGKTLVPKYWASLWHTPYRNVNHTLFTSTFVHGGLPHLILNMYACQMFLPQVGYSRVFEGNSNHTLAFFLTTGVLSGYAQHLLTRFSKTIFTPSGGASGAIFAVLGVYCAQYPDAQLGLLFVPGSLDAQYFLALIMLVDLVGMIRPMKFLPLGHAAHFSGAVMGLGYSYLDGKNVIWNPLVQYWRNRLRKQT
ncbi:hypothetical protein BDV95DRAFT_493815 [Massariosphaeria phaeospora]|uniref:Peptidase S54 rhomboid domain-containing protein n=1 Tax=Massariosphaeria phaeospora TaxID=100035 RepID=A0A7C8M895_9PLEO|nr:hypothetical protein BDV95DRAFT_493815 [Massariosphaeria phaeospora]